MAKTIRHAGLGMWGICARLLSASIFLFSDDLHNLHVGPPFGEATRLPEGTRQLQSHPLGTARVEITTRGCGRIVGTSGVLAQKDGFKWISMQRIAPGEKGAQNR